MPAAEGGAIGALELLLAHLVSLRAQADGLGAQLDLSLPTRRLRVHEGCRVWAARRELAVVSEQRVDPRLLGRLRVRFHRYRLLGGDAGVKPLEPLLQLPPAELR
jgi:hypothetical protein